MCVCHDEEFDLYSIENEKLFKVYNSRSDMGEKIKLGPYLTFCAMVNSKWVKDCTKNKTARRKCK